MIYLKFEQMECNLTQIVAQIETTLWMKTKVKGFDYLCQQ
jgi:hypothetical protein